MNTWPSCVKMIKWWFWKHAMVYFNGSDIPLNLDIPSIAKEGDRTWMTWRREIHILISYGEGLNCVCCSPQRNTHWHLTLSTCECHIFWIEGRCNVTKLRSSPRLGSIFTQISERKSWILRQTVKMPCGDEGGHWNVLCISLWMPRFTAISRSGGGFVSGT